MAPTEFVSDYAELTGETTEKAVKRIDAQNKQINGDAAETKDAAPATSTPTEAPAAKATPKAASTKTA